MFVLRPWPEITVFYWSIGWLYFPEEEKWWSPCFLILFKTIFWWLLDLFFAFVLTWCFLFLNISCTDSWCSLYCRLNFFYAFFASWASTTRLNTLCFALIPAAEGLLLRSCRNNRNFCSLYQFWCFWQSWIVL